MHEKFSFKSVFKNQNMHYYLQSYNKIVLFIVEKSGDEGGGVKVIFKNCPITIAFFFVHWSLRLSLHESSRKNISVR